MKKNKLVCPYCGKFLNFSQAFQTKTYEEYWCPQCEQISRVFVKKSIETLIAILLVLVGIALSVFSFFFRHYLWGTALLIFLYVLFYIQVPNFIVLKKKI